jgi:hypothetical protein
MVPPGQHLFCRSGNCGSVVQSSARPGKPPHRTVRGPPAAAEEPLDAEATAAAGAAPESVLVEAVSVDEEAATPDCARGPMPVLWNDTDSPPPPPLDAPPEKPELEPASELDP